MDLHVRRLSNLRNLVDAESTGGDLIEVMRELFLLKSPFRSAVTIARTTSSFGLPSLLARSPSPVYWQALQNLRPSEGDVTE